eukprot:Lithocolla_globosa_v1_NODE_628_length_3566_cov_26.375107.p3 type:complete len:184 gc:universal NODE_628_length_3566_cov_26.375107:2460-3011(+)
MFEYVILHRLTAHLLPDIHDEQGAYQPRRSHVDQVFTLMETLLLRRTMNLGTFVLFLDLKSAFDLIWTSGLFHKLLSARVDGPLWATLHDLYVNMKTMGRWNGELTGMILKIAGTQQGSPLSALFFIFFVNDLITDLKKAGVGVSLTNDLLLCVLMLSDDLTLIADSLHDMNVLLRVQQQTLP